MIKRNPKTRALASALFALLLCGAFVAPAFAAETGGTLEGVVKPEPAPIRWRNEGVRPVIRL